MMRIEFCMACLTITVPEKVKYTTTLIRSMLHSVKLHKFVERCHLSQNLWLKMLMSSDCFYDSIYYDHYCGILFVNE